MPSPKRALNTSAAATSLLLLNDLGVFEHRRSAVARHFAFERNRLARVLGQLVVHRFVLAYDEINLPLAEDANRAAAFNAFRRTIRVFIARGVVIDVAHHVDDLAGDSFFRRGSETIFVMLIGESERRQREGSRKHNGNGRLDPCGTSAVGINHPPSSDDFVIGQ